MQENSKFVNVILRQLITSKGYSFKFVAEKTGIKYHLLIGYLTKSQKIDILDYFSLCKFLNLDPTYIVDEVVKRKEN